MLRNLRMLLSVRAWLRSTNLQAGGLVLALGQIQVWFASDDGMRILALIAGALHLTGETFSGLLLSVVGGAMLILRAKTEWSLYEKAHGATDATVFYDAGKLLALVGVIFTFCALSPHYAQADESPCYAALVVPLPAERVRF